MKTTDPHANLIIWAGTTMRLNLNDKQVQQRTKAQIAAANAFFKKQCNAACKGNQ